MSLHWQRRPHNPETTAPTALSMARLRSSSGSATRGPSVNNVAMPCTDAHAAYSAPGRRSIGSAPAVTRSLRSLFRIAYGILESGKS